MMVSRSVGIMPNPLDKREIVYTNLLLLDFDPVTMESREKIPFNRDMFALPNKKVMEVVMYFLFSKLNPQMTYEEFRDCWPVKNKVDEQKFRKTCYNWVTRLSKEESDTYFPRVVQSLFHSPGGDKFYDFLRLFSMYVLKVVMLRDHSRHVSIPTFPSKSIHNHSFTQVISKSLKIHTSLHRKRFLDLTQYCLEVQQQWIAYATDLNKENRSLKKKKRDLEKQLQKEVNYKGKQMAKSIALSSDYQKEVDAIQRTRDLQKVRTLWKGLEDYFLEHKPQVVDSIVSNQANQHCLDATNVEIKIPDLLLREFERDIHKKKISNTYVGGKLNLLSLVQLWNLSLTLIKERIRQDSVPSFDDSSPKINNDIHKHQTLLSNTEYLRSTLTKETIPELKQSVEQLKSRIYEEMVELEGSSHPLSFNLGLGLVPATPPVSFAAAETPVSQRIPSFQESLKRTPNAVSTPDVIHAWSDSLRGRRPPAEAANLSKLSQQESKRTRKVKPSHQTNTPEPKTIQTGHPRNHYKIGQQKQNRIISKKGLSSSARRQATTTTRATEIISPLAVDQTSKVARTEPRRTSFRGSLKHKGKSSATANVASQIIGALSADKPDSRSSSSQSSRSSSPKPQAINDPLEALSETAFVSRDLITRTPAPAEKYDLSSDGTITPQGDLLNSSGGLLETILDQVTKPLSTQMVRTALFSSPDDLHGDENHHSNEDRHGNDSNRPRMQLLTPFDFQTPGVSKDGNLNDKQLEEDNLTPFTFITPVSGSTMTRDNQEYGFLSSKVEQKPFARETPKIQKLIEFTPFSKHLVSSSVTTSDKLQSPYSLSKIFEEKLSLSKENTLSPGLPHMPYDKGTPMDHDNGVVLDSKSPKISLFEPVVMNDSWNDDVEDQQEPKRSPFGAWTVSDDEDQPQKTETTGNDDTNNTDSFKDMQQSDLMSRLNKIKAAQQYDFKYLSSQQNTGERSPGNGQQDVAMETIQAERLDQIKEAQQGQQVTPGANTQSSLDPYRGTEGALLTPLTISSGGSPENGNNDYMSRFPQDNNVIKSSNLSTPTSVLSEQFLMESPHRKNREEAIIFSLDSPVIPDHFSSPEEPSSSEKELNSGAAETQVQMSASSSEHLWNSVHSPIPSSPRIDNKLLWLTTNGTTSKDFMQPSDRRLSDGDFLNESIDTSFLVQNTPLHDRHTRDFQSSFQSPVGRHNTSLHDNSPLTTVTSRPLATSPAIGQLIDF